MEDLELKIGQLLSDPDAMSNILSLAKNFGLMSPAADTAPAAASPPQEEDPPPTNFGGIESLLSGLGGGGFAGGGDLLGILPTVMGLLSEAEKVDPKQAALWGALRPFLRPDRQEKIDKAMRVARLGHVANYALRNWDHNP